MSFLALASFAARANTICDGAICGQIFESNGTLFAEFDSLDQTKAPPGLISVDSNIAPYDLPIFLDGLPGVDCNGSLSPGSSSGATGGQIQGVGMVCTIEGAGNSIFRITVSITWMFNSTKGSWEVLEIDVQVRTIRPPNSNQPR